MARTTLTSDQAIQIIECQLEFNEIIILQVRELAELAQYYICRFFFFFFCLFRLYPQYVEVPRLRVESEL